MPRFSANLGFLFTEVPFLDRFAAARRAGFSAVEFADPYSFPEAELHRRLEGLACVLFNLPMGDRTRGDMGIACLPDRVSEFREGVARAVELARALCCPRLNCIAGLAPPGVPRQRLRETLIENLRFAVAAATGLTVQLEPINSVVDWPGFFVDRCAFARQIIAHVPGLRLQLDVYHHVVSEGVLPPLAELLPLTSHVQFADVPGRHEPGTGTIDHQALFAALDQLGYDGWVGAEYRPTRRTEETLGWFSPL